jgi:hypothetical protein
MTREELTPHIGQRIKHDGPHNVNYGTLTRLTDRTADFTDEEDESFYHTEIDRISPAPKPAESK